ncbi:MAG: tRNA (adenosine(37)-N6)-threonylcarbamoyltransferase complex ATPase subunit type 1 TsaE [Clostridia bacterium]|nr:tRNA (adenosine(37)-N6)-threonylcarbamoyltransferase complex ATPase subunit type 1 TsaE [Clostridia bacterium]
MTEREKTVLLSSSTEETERIAANLAESLKPGSVVALYGEMGAGKTAFARGVVRALCPECLPLVHSPTFAIVNEYVGKHASVYHFDFYRIRSGDDLYSTGYDEYRDRGGVLLTEWSEKIPEAIPEDAVRVRLEKLSETERRIEIC